MHPLDIGIIAFYAAAILWLGFRTRLQPESSTSELILGGRMLTVPAFAASLVSTWYGGILGIGEYTYRYGLSNWLVFGLPYYVAAFLFAIFLAKKARQSELLTIPDRLAKIYDTKTAVLGASIIYLMTVPGAYILILGVLCQTLFGWPFWTGAVAGSLFSIIYLFLGGFKSVVRTDIFQTVLMFLGFIVLVIYLIATYGGFEFLQSRLPENHLTWHGGQPTFYIATWYVIALATLTEPAFFQRCYAAKSGSVARNGIFLSIGFWALFDFLTTTCGLYARVLMPDLADPVTSFPALAQQILPVGVLGLFVLAMFATAQSTADSYFFIAATTFSNDIIGRLRKLDNSSILKFTHIGLWLTAVLAIVCVLVFRSVVDIWYAFGSIGTPALLIPVFFSFVGNRRLSGTSAFWTIVLSGSLSAVWYLSQYWTPDNSFWFGLQPIFPGLALSLFIYGLFAKRTPSPLPSG